MTGSVRKLTWQSVIKQEFSQPGQYTLTLEVFNPVSSIFYTQSVDVYGKLLQYNNICCGLRRFSFCILSIFMPLNLKKNNKKKKKKKRWNLYKRART